MHQQSGEQQIKKNVLVLDKQTNASNAIHAIYTGSVAVIINVQ